jgi:hypothetical protein
MAVLGISVNSRVIGTAVIKDHVLIDYGVKLFKQRWSIHKAQKIIESITTQINDYGITSIALTIPYDYHESAETKALIVQIKSYCRKEKINLLSYHPKTFHAFCPEAKAKKKALMKCLADRYPELRIPYKKELQNQQRYYHKLFEAVAAATLQVQGMAGNSH